MTASLETQKLKEWFLATKRDLPWRQHPTPYAVWISEVMLQQTQVAVVIPYFLRWMQRFPSIESLAQASLDEVIKEWEGLGYYSRVRHLHAGARYMVEHFQGQLPREESALKQIKGLGPYTIGAILSFAFHQKKAAVDGNVLRVLARYFQIEDDITKPATIKRLRLIADQLLPDEEHWLVNEGLIELGATVCQKKAHCKECPLQHTCLAYRHGKVDQLPFKSKQVKITYLYRAVAVIMCEGQYLVKRGQKGKIMSDLHEFPYFEIANEPLQEVQFRQRIQEEYGLETKFMQQLAPVTQSFTRYQAQLRPCLFACSTPIPVAGLNWLSLSDLKTMAFSSGHRRILQGIQNVPSLD